MKNRFKIRFIFVALMAWFIGVFPAFGHGSFVDRTIQRNILGFKTTELIGAIEEHR